MSAVETSMATIRSRRRGSSITEALAALAAVALLGATVVPVMSRTECDYLKQVSMNNLRTLAAAHATYEADWKGRQFTLVRDDLGAYGSCAAYQAAQGCHPPLILGTDCEGETEGFFFCAKQGGDCSQFDVVPPLNFIGAGHYLGSFRIPNARGFHEYVNGRFFDPVFYAPKDAPIYQQVRPLFGQDCEYVDTGEDLTFSSSYALSPAAMFHPDVMRPNDQGGFQYPWDLPQGFASPPASLATYPALKTRMLEHNWLQQHPEVDWYGLPYRFNNSYRSNPVTLFFDGHVRGLSVMEAMQADIRVEHQTNQGLWSRDTAFGTDGYMIDLSYDYASTSYHILTTCGILGRDTIAPP